MSPSILLVDDDPGFRDALANAFRTKGWSVRIADRCAQVLGASLTAAPDHLVIEQDLRDGSGISLFQCLRAVKPSLSAVMLARRASVANAVEAIRTGFRDYRAKPLDCRQLPAVFDEVDKASKDLSRSANDTTSVTASLATVEWKHIQSVLTHTRGNVSEAARVLGLHRRSLQRKLSRGPVDELRIA